MLEGDALWVHLTSQCAFDFFFFFPPYFSTFFIFLYNMKAGGKKNCKIKNIYMESILNSDTGIHFWSSTLFPFLFIFDWFYFYFYFLWWWWFFSRKKEDCYYYFFFFLYKCIAIKLYIFKTCETVKQCSLEIKECFIDLNGVRFIIFKFII